MAKNLCGKTVTPENAYEVWQSPDGSFTYYVLRKYKSPEGEDKDLYARWYCMTVSPACPKGEYGDCYAAQIKSENIRINNPLAGSEELCDMCETWVASHLVQVDTTIYHVCDKPRCQDQANALRDTHDQTIERPANRALTVQALTDDVREHFTVTDLKPRARKHKQYQIDLPAGCVHTISKERSIVGPIEYYDCLDGRIIIVDHAWQQTNAFMKKREVS